MDKQAIKNFAVFARTKLISAVKSKAALIGITEKEIQSPLPTSQNDLLFFDVGADQPYAIKGKDALYRKSLVERLWRAQRKGDYATAYRALIEETAYTWFNRMIAIRFMEVNHYLPNFIRVLSSDQPDKREPDIVTRPFESGLSLTPEEELNIREWKQKNELDALFRFLFIKECELLGTLLPGIFTKTGGDENLLFPLNFTDPQGVISRLISDIPEENFDIQKGGQIEIIGWLYQYYNTEPKAEVYALLAKNVKVSKENIPAATQLFTPDWIVRYMVENSLGRLWLESHSNDELKAKWKYYLDEAPQTDEVNRAQEKTKRTISSPEEIRFIDPCMGSGHILVYAFELLMQIYESVGYAKRDAAQKIIENNLYGLDIDERAYQLAYFAVMMKGREYNRGILKKGLTPKVFAVKNSDFLTDEIIEAVAEGDSSVADDLTRLKEAFENGDEFGSLVEAPSLDYRRLKGYCLRQVEAEGSLFHANLEGVIREEVLPLVETAETMVRKYDVVVTNPPYMGGKNMNAKLAAFVREKYPDSKADLFAAFMERCGGMAVTNGFIAMITQHSWMFLSSFEKLRKAILWDYDIINMAHLGARAFEEIGGEVVQTTSWVMRRN